MNYLIWRIRESRKCWFSKYYFSLSCQASKYSKSSVRNLFQFCYVLLHQVVVRQQQRFPQQQQEVNELSSFSLVLAVVPPRRSILAAVCRRAACVCWRHMGSMAGVSPTFSHMVATTAAVALLLYHNNCVCRKHTWWKDSGSFWGDLHMPSSSLKKIEKWRNIHHPFIS